ncbi:NAD(P)/FAD-dependent oxidoreductase [Hoyosella rhizosphaerae]|uniref:NADH:ubiquinone reductase (non-electrogenic) n=1 Tax=Hoyosella rhizosphaerae TaxID=1755582 RepID=A0A916U0R0_9ACTN|nr:NAD(P)/FAD-dependent oxidoreductase [Hoyosella rhizosphaerae]MBN4927003.1 NAD(P)/FAD-dependent oxidoreductase [Hoyosella rhizosphaerae]GGC54806.1 putative NADH dehydrogenase (NDH) [Hoyosella rhizosphaerae]
MSRSTTTARHHVVIVGSGFGSMFAARQLKNADVDVTVIARSTHHLFQPLLYQVATGILSVGEIAVPNRVILRRYKNTRVLLGDVVDIDVRNQTVTSEAADHAIVTSYDSLIVAAGAEQSYFGNDHFAKYAPGMKTIDHALELRGKIIAAFEHAELSHDPEEQKRLLTFVVVGAGPTGVEMAGQIAELAKRTLTDAFRNADPASARIILLDAAPQVLPPMGKKLGNKAQRKLEKMGVEVLLDTFVTDIDEGGFVVKDKDGNQYRIPAYCKIWAAGVSASPLGKQLADQTGTELDRAGRVKVNPDLTIEGQRNVFVVGDMMALGDVPGIAPAAIQSGTYVAKRIKDDVKAELNGEALPDRKPFKYLDKGSIAVVSKYNAVGKVMGGKVPVSGLIGWLMWLGVHLFYLVGFKNRYTTLMYWLITFISNSRTQLNVTEQWMNARVALEQVEEEKQKELDAR